MSIYYLDFKHLKDRLTRQKPADIHADNSSQPDKDNPPVEFSAPDLVPALAAVGPAAEF